MEKEGKIYVLKDPLTYEVRVIGQTKQKKLKRRLYTYLYDSLVKNEKWPSCNWIRKLAQNNLLPIIEEIETTDINNLNDREIYWISYYRNLYGSNILNLQNGGQGANPIRKPNIKNIYGINRFTLERVEFTSTAEAATKLNCKQSNIPKAIFGKGECRGHYLSYTEFEENWLPPRNKQFTHVCLENGTKKYYFKTIGDAIIFTGGNRNSHKNGAKSALNKNLIYRNYRWFYFEGPLVITSEKQGELLETPTINNEDNQQPSFSRNTIEGSTTNSRVLTDNAEDSNANTSALLSN
jgi:hypothetical protein